MLIRTTAQVVRTGGIDAAMQLSAASAAAPGQIRSRRALPQALLVIAIRAVDAGLFDSTLATRGAKNEFGVDAPERAFMRRTAITKRAEWRALARVVVSESRRGANPKVSMGVLGRAMATAIRDSIDASLTWALPNAPATIAKKGFDHPLLETAAMLNSLAFRIAPN